MLLFFFFFSQKKYIAKDTCGSTRTAFVRAFVAFLIARAVGQLVCLMCGGSLTCPIS